MGDRGVRIGPGGELAVSLVSCPWCGSDTGELVMMDWPGYEPPRQVTISYDPCPDCAALWGQGVAMLEVKDRPIHENQPPIQKEPDLYPTGRLAVVRTEAIPHLVQPAELAEEIAAKGRCYVDAETFSALGLDQIPEEAH